ncbi:hypothetical protein ElyMa_000739000 [Elysia marginata]|uniref:Endonuclease/exonuclease/phosphatase domain-containing protein n=1 Tax=Elysia marginata TaxID=1093978 RepID=A0AAV4GPC6_9GAST|nr:hypothetical protein ElyMa_000739000 [Elysia marginata]
MSGQKHPNKASLVALLLFVSSFLDLSTADTCRTLTTFNGGLTPRISNYGYRREVQPFALLDEESDIMCLQEFWFQEDIDYTLSKVSHKFKYHFSPLHSSLNVFNNAKRERLIPEAPCSIGDSAYFSFRIKDFGTVLCSHFSALFPVYFEYDDLGFSDYKQQQLAEMAVIHNKFASRDHVIMGDFNTGPRVETANSPDKVLVGEVPDNYQIWLDNGYK